MERDQEERIRGILNKLNQDELTPHPYLKTRILAESEALNESRKKLNFWRLVSTLALTSLVVTVLMTSFKRKSLNTLALNRPYVIHVNFSDKEVGVIAAAEIELPKGVHFYSDKNPQVREMRKLRLPVGAQFDGRTRLPFVIVADKAKGIKKIQVRLFDTNNNLVKENFIKVNLNRS